MKNVRTVIWDCDNVMWFHKCNEAYIFANALGITPDNGGVEEFQAEFVQMIEKFNSYFVNRKVTMDEFYKIIEQTMPILFLNNISPKDFMNVWNGLKFEINVTNKDVIPVMKNLTKKGYINIIKTDWWRDVQVEQLKHYGIMKYIERIYSCDNGYLKANLNSVREIIRKGKEEQYVMVGDTLTTDICFAQNAGIKSIWFNQNYRQKNNTDFKPTYEIGSLLELTEIL